MIQPGSQYTIQPADTLKTIAARAYGDESLWTKIADANPSSSVLRIVVNPYTFPIGETIYIPELPDRQRRISAVVSPEDQNKTKMTISVYDYPVEILRAKIYTSIDTMADSMMVEYVWNPGENPGLDIFTQPFRYATIDAKIGQTKLISAAIFDVKTRFSDQGRVKILSSFSYAKHAVDSSVIEPYQYSSVTLEEILKIQLERFNIFIFMDVPVVEPFERVTANKGDTIFNFLSKLTTQRGVLITSMPDGNLRVLKVPTTDSIGVIEEGKTQIVQSGGWQSAFSGQNRFKSYTAFGNSPALAGKGKTLVDDEMIVPRFHSFPADDATEGNIQQILEWKRSKMAGDSMTFRLPVIGWYGPDNKLWQKNTIVTVKSETMFIPDGYDLLIVGVEYSYTTAGKTATLHLKPPQTYTKEKIPEPWL
jgi:prophage tail gpP-like protein